MFMKFGFSMSKFMDFCMWKKVWSEWSMAERGVSTKPGQIGGSAILDTAYLYPGENFAYQFPFFSSYEKKKNKCPARQFNHMNLTGWVETNVWQNRRLFYIFDNEFHDRHCQLSAGRQKCPSRHVIVDFKFATNNVTFSMRKKRNGVVVMSLSASTLCPMTEKFPLFYLSQKTERVRYFGESLQKL